MEPISTLTFHWHNSYMQQPNPKSSPKSAETIYSDSILVEGSTDAGHDAKQKVEETLNDNACHTTIPSAPHEKSMPTGSTTDIVPEGGLRAWLVVLGGACCHFATYGYGGTWGVFQAYYQHTFLEEMSPSAISWIGSIQHATAVIPYLILGHFFDKGYFHSTFIAASVLLVVATMLVAECTSYWQFMLCQGIITGLCVGIICTPVSPIITQWFREKRALALSLSALGTALGGTMFPIVARQLLPLVGFQWTIRVMGVIISITLLLGNLTIRRRLPPAEDTPSPLITFAPLKHRAFLAYCSASICLYFGIRAFTTYVASAAVSKGIPEDFAFYLVSITNGISGVGKISAGFLSLRTGILNYMIATLIATTIVIIGWPTAATQPALIAIAVLFGFTSGGYSALTYPPVIELGDPKHLFGRLGLLSLSIAIGGLSGPPIAGEIHKIAGLQVMGFYAGGWILLGVGLLLFMTYSLLGKVWGKV
ncbi:hypothetical protein VNI00_014161 [Paramarasmius palmivorus]|uniref:Major facilitator superfamily (MFS) profile domain-containing protein n=1 Tax=Paramarasmius palmivorus TaxID=297713 RepID=A0AAW0BV01_9AGAR